MATQSNFTRYVQIMIFYVLISYVIFPLIGYYVFGKTLQTAGHGFVIGSIISIALWYSYGRKLIHK